ncbi:hypothetical protein SAV31267_048320 [Streptomyces avermitilis]|uniref:Orc1-like AAA ATPase domain-containing protein n=1 Tax=Streptomyces avermitilis TaxID=33903 RepID=A0A4D4MWA7_STRAX|nr:hypothetical protein SAV31267_048320 [Streptomyces avermitilis]
MRRRAGGLVRIDGTPAEDERRAAGNTSTQAGNTGSRTGATEPRTGDPGARTGDEPPPQRTLLTVAVREYPDGDEDFTAGIDEQLSVVTDWWCDPEADEPFHRVVQPELHERYDVERFLHEARVRETGGQALVLFVTGHGKLGASGTHFLQLPKTELRRQLATAIRTSEIVAAALDSRAEHVLVIVNTCYAEAIAGELSELHKEIRQSRREQGSLDVIATCAQDQLVQVGRFPSVMRQVLRRLRTNAQITTPWLSVGDLMTEFESELRGDTERRRHRLRRIIDGGGQTVLTPCLPNPGYRPRRQLVGPARRQVATPAEDIDIWLDRASGRPQEADPGWYFSGRERLNRELAVFLTRPEGVLLLTGTAGSGKSAVLGRAVTLSDPLFRENADYADAVRSASPRTVPPENSVSVAVLARHRSAADVLRDLLLGLGVAPRPLGPTDDPVDLWGTQLDTHLAEPGETLTLVVDGLDEAYEPFRIVRDVLAPLNAHCAPSAPLPGQRGPARQPAEPEGQRRNLRLLIGVRSSRPPAHLAAPGDPPRAPPSPGRPSPRNPACSPRCARSSPRRRSCARTTPAAGTTSPPTSRRSSARRTAGARARAGPPKPSPTGCGPRSWTPGWRASS